jgi:hypothetical protein
VINRAGNGVPVRPPIRADGDENLQDKAGRSMAEKNITQD